MIMNRYGAIEAGGTKFLCAIGNSRGEILNHTRIETVDPEPTIARVLDYFRNAEMDGGAAYCIRFKHVWADRIAARLTTIWVHHNNSKGGVAEYKHPWDAQEGAAETNRP